MTKNQYLMYIVGKILIKYFRHLKNLLYSFTRLEILHTLHSDLYTFEEIMIQLLAGFS
jgi:hypothetical protein